MANRFYAHGAEHLMTGGINLETDTFYALLVNTNEVPAFDTDEFLSDIDSTSRTPLGSGGYNMTNPTCAGGVFDADDVVASGVSGTQIQAVVIFRYHATAELNFLLCWLDDATGLPMTPNGSDITIQWSDGDYKIFSFVP